MKLFGNKRGPLEGSKIPRVSNLSDNELMSWFNNLIMDVGTNFDTWRYHDTPLEELEMSMDSLIEIWTELKVRRRGRPDS